MMRTIEVDIHAVDHVVTSRMGNPTYRIITPQGEWLTQTDGSVGYAARNFAPRFREESKRAVLHLRTIRGQERVVNVTEVPPLRQVTVADLRPGEPFTFLGPGNVKNIFESTKGGEYVSVVYHVPFLITRPGEEFHPTFVHRPTTGYILANTPVWVK